MDSVVICNPKKISHSVNNIGLRDASASKNADLAEVGTPQLKVTVFAIQTLQLLGSPIPLTTNFQFVQSSLQLIFQFLSSSPFSHTCLPHPRHTKLCRMDRQVENASKLRSIAEQLEYYRRSGQEKSKSAISSEICF